MNPDVDDGKSCLGYSCSTCREPVKRASTWRRGLCTSSRRRRRRRRRCRRSAEHDELTLATGLVLEHGDRVAVGARPGLLPAAPWSRGDCSGLGGMRARRGRGWPRADSSVATALPLPILRLLRRLRWQADRQTPSAGGGAACVGGGPTKGRPVPRRSGRRLPVPRLLTVAAFAGRRPVRGVRGRRPVAAGWAGGSGRRRLRAGSGPAAAGCRVAAPAGPSWSWCCRLP